MKVIKCFLSVLWRLWFYIWMTLVIIVLSPLLLITIRSEQSYPSFYKVARIWAKVTFYGIGMRYEVDEHQQFEKGKSYMFIANHTSMLDIMMMFILIKDNPFVFVGKKELANIPIFGYFYKKTCILVDRTDSKSRYKVFESAQDRLKQGLSICIFPEGGVTDDRTVILDHFKDGAFRLAIEHQIPIASFALGKLRHFFPFVWGIGYPGKVPVIMLPIIDTTGLSMNDRNAVKAKAFTMIKEPVEKWEKEMSNG